MAQQRKGGHNACSVCVERLWQAVGWDAEYFGGECTKTQIKYQKNVHWPLNSVCPQPYRRVSPTGPSAGAAMWMIAVWG